MLNTATGNELL